MDIGKILITRDSKMNFLRGLIRIAKCDGVQDDGEIMFFRQTAQALGLEEEDIIELDRHWKSDGKDRIMFDTNKEKMFFFVQAVQLCWVDDEYKDIEKREIHSMAEELGVSSMALESVEQWAYEGIVWNRKGDSLLELI